MSAKTPLLFLGLLLIIFCLVLPGRNYAQNIGTLPVVSDQEKRFCIQAIDGYAYLSENMTLAQTRKAAFANAKRQALEAAMTYIRSKTKVKDFEVEYDLIWSDAEGAVTILEQKDYGVEENTRYHVWIKAKVMYVKKPKRVEPAEAALIRQEASLLSRTIEYKRMRSVAHSITSLVQRGKLKVMCWKSYWKIYPLNKMTVDMEEGFIRIRNSTNIHNHAKLIFNKTLRDDFVAAIELEGDYLDLQLQMANGQDGNIYVNPSEQGIKTDKRQTFIIARKNNTLSFQTESGFILRWNSWNATEGMDCYIAIAVQNGKSVKIHSWMIEAD